MSQAEDTASAEALGQYRRQEDLWLLKGCWSVAADDLEGRSKRTVGLAEFEIFIKHANRDVEQAGKGVYPRDWEKN